MSPELTAAIELLTTTRGDLDLAAVGLAVDGAEVAQELTKANPDSAQAVALRCLARRYVPAIAPVSNAKTSTEIPTPPG